MQDAGIAHIMDGFSSEKFNDKNSLFNRLRPHIKEPNREWYKEYDKTYFPED